MNRIIKVILFLVICSLIALWSPWTNWNLDLNKIFGIQAPEVISGLQIYSLSGELEIYVDNNLVGSVDEEDSPFTVDKVMPGEHLFTLKRKSEVKNAYWIVNKLITFEAGTNVVASYNVGPEEEFTEGHIIYTIKRIDKNSSPSLNINLNVDNAVVTIDSNSEEEVLGKFYSTVLSYSQQHSITIFKDGYEKLEFSILPTSQEERDKLKDFNLNIEAHLMLQPVEVE